MSYWSSSSSEDDESESEFTPQQELDYSQQVVIKPEHGDLVQDDLIYEDIGVFQKDYKQQLETINNDIS